MISADEYNRIWTEKLVKNKKEEFSFIDFFGFVEYDTIEKMPSFDIGKKKEKQPTNFIRSQRIWVEGTRDNFAIYIYDEKNDTNYYFKADYYANTKAYVYRVLPKDQNKKTFYSIKYYQNYPVIVTLDEKIPKKYLIISGGKFAHTSDVNKALKQSLKNFYYFNDDITKKLIKEYEDHQLLLKRLKMGGIVLLVIILLIVAYIMYKKFTKPKKSLIIDEGYYDDYGDYEDDDEE